MSTDLRDELPVLKSIHPNTTEADLLRVADAFDRFAVILLKCFEELLADPERYKRFLALTQEHDRGKKKGVSNDDTK
jgi:hypothetical protein